MPVDTVKWKGGIDGALELIDQTALPERLRVLTVRTVGRLWRAIKRMEIRGAPAIGVAAAFGPVLAAQKPRARETKTLLAHVLEAIDYLGTSRPTAVNLFWALERVGKAARKHADRSPRQFRKELLAEARRILEEDKTICRKMGRNGARLIPEGARVLTHCNAGGLATADYGTALAAMFEAHAQKKKIHVFVDETRPLLQGARLTTWELMREGIDCTLICDSMAAQVMKEGRVDMVITGADCIAANGDAANKIGTYGLSVLARYHKIPFYIVAPTSSFDLTLRSGKQIPIEERGAEEITCGFGRRTAPKNVKVYSPAFDVTPHRNITAIVTEKGIIRTPNRETVAKALAK
ncbi:MAG: methylthioribose-1-phosphate isomerase [Planctomycetes bacterium DG_58]|nr:MAG: methylthioribose-1-phosphate isomerase [Planctomycetes bacterium DG_58]KPL01512.1 MAG: methylthioribose-1-phosphate isomerase [Planctomycetes bacterium SM23_65]